uniref:Transmembrane protein 168 n=1 Tax=Eptatretus burgeri TaxID=7764 RepID=A0A8C4R9A6_EPTBU
MKSLRYIVSHCLQVVMNAAQHETGRNGGMRSAFRFLGFIVNGLLLVALSLGLFTRWEHSGDTNLLVMFVMGLVVFLIACVLSYYFSMENACTNIAHLVFGFLLGFLALVDQANLIDDSKEEASRYLLLLSIFTRSMLSISSRFFRATRFASTLLLSTEFLELVGFGAASAALTMERCFDVSLLLCAFGLCLADLRMKSLLALPTMIGFSVISVLLFFPALDLSINPFALGCFFGRLLCDPLIDLFYSGLTVTERWHPYLQAHKMLRRFSVLVLLLAELLFIILSAFTLGNVNRWYILRLLGIIVFGILWVTSHLVLVTALWAFHNRLNNCLGACALLRTGSKSLDDVMASRGMRQYCLVAEQLVFGALIFTILMAVVCWQEKNGTFIALFMFILPLESLVFGLFHELGSCLGGTCIGYSLIIPTAYCSPDKQPMPLPPELVETINLRATTMLHAIQRFFARYMVENFGCDYSTSGVNLDNLQGKLRTFFDQRTDDGARHDTYILHYSGHTHNSGEWALAGCSRLICFTLPSGPKSAIAFRLVSSHRLLTPQFLEFLHQFLECSFHSKMWVCKDN